MAKASDRLKKGGGFLNGVDGVVTGYVFTDEFNGEPFVPGKKDDGKDKFHSLFARVSVRPDGAEEDVTTSLFAGGFDDFTISPDGHALTAKEDGRGVSAKSAFGKLIQSMEAKGHPGADPRSDEEVTANPNVYDFSAIIGHRFRFVQVPDESMKGKKKTGKNGRGSYDYTTPAVDTYYGPASGFKANVKAPSSGSANAAATSPEDLRELAAQFVVKTVIKANDAEGGVIKQNKLNTPSLTHFNGNPKRDEIRKFIFGDMKELTEEAVTYEGADYFITFDAATKEVRVSKA